MTAGPQPSTFVLAIGIARYRDAAPRNASPHTNRSEHYATTAHTCGNTGSGQGAASGQ